MPKTLLRTVAFASLACVVAFSACQPQPPQGAESSGLTELNDESLNEDDVTSEVVSTTEDVTTTAPETTTSEVPVAVSSAAAETTSTSPATTSTLPATTSTATPATTTIAESTTTSSPALIVTTTSAPESTTTSMPMSSSLHSIDISGFSFAPSAVTIRVGDTVTWTNLDSAIHTVTFSGSASLSSSGLREGDTHSATFDAVGTFAFGCSPHPSMQGTITVIE